MSRPALVFVHPTATAMRFDSRRSLDRLRLQLAGLSHFRDVGSRLFLSSVVWRRLVASDARIENALHACDQIYLRERLGQIASDAALQRARPCSLVWIGSDQDGGNGLPGCNQPVMEVRPGHSRHLDVGDQAGGSASALRI